MSVKSVSKQSGASAQNVRRQSASNSNPDSGFLHLPSDMIEDFGLYVIVILSAAISLSILGILLELLFYLFAFSILLLFIVSYSRVRLSINELYDRSIICTKISIDDSPPLRIDLRISEDGFKIRASTRQTVLDRIANLFGRSKNR